MENTTDTLPQGVIGPSVQGEENKISSFWLGVTDYVNGFKKWNLWLYLAYADIRRRYRRTVIGPFWATLSVAIFIASMGVLFSALWHRNMHEYLPFLVSESGLLYV